jgi:hypothetical protein
MTNPPDHSEWHRLFNAALNDELSDADSLELAAVLKSSAEARQLWFLYHDNECSLAELSPAVEPTTHSTGLSWFSWRQLTAVAAGLFIGLFGASVVWGYVGPYAGKVVTLLQESFESGPPPLTTGIPVEAGHWSGDYSQIVGEYRGVKPAGGRKMLRFLRSDYEGKPTRDGFIGDMFRIIDVSGPEYDVARGDACVSVEARFLSLPQGIPGPASCGISMHATDALPTPDERLEFMEITDRSHAAAAAGPLHSGMTILATSVRNARIETSRNAWGALRGELRLPPGTRFLLVHLSLFESNGPRAPQPCEFAGLFVDDIRIVLTHRPPLP